MSSYPSGPKAPSSSKVSTPTFPGRRGSKIERKLQTSSRMDEIPTRVHRLCCSHTMKSCGNNKKGLHPFLTSRMEFQPITFHWEELAGSGGSVSGAASPSSEDSLTLERFSHSSDFADWIESVAAPNLNVALKLLMETRLALHATEWHGNTSKLQLCLVRIFSQKQNFHNLQKLEESQLVLTAFLTLINIDWNNIWTSKHAKGFL